MLRVAIGENGSISSITRNGEFLPVIRATIHMAVDEPTRIELHMVEHRGDGLHHFGEVVEFGQEEIDMVVIK